MKTTFLTLFCFFISFAFLAQDYSNAVGFRGGLSNGLTFKHFLSADHAAELILVSRWKGIGITGLYEIHKSIKNSKTFKYYYGGGAHLGFWDGENVKWGTQESYTVIGVDGILGIEYCFQSIPINLSLDWKPAFNLVGHQGFWGDDGALSIRYMF